MLILSMPVRKVISFFLVILMGVSIFSFGELMKVPELVNHFKFHKKKNHHIDFHQFLFLHYSIENGTDDDADSDRQLPFNSAEAYLATLKPVSSFNEGIYVTKNLFIDNTSYFLANDRFVPFNFNSDVWQPPRV